MAKSKVMETLNEMKKLAGYMKKMNEDYFMDDEVEGQDMHGEGPMKMPHHQEEHESNPEEETIMHANQVLQEEPIVGKIREIAIDGLKKYADQPTSEIFKFFKSVFLDSDKLLTNTGKAK